MVPSDSPAPSPRCPLCRKGPCPFHAARTPEDLAKSVLQAVQLHGAVGLYHVCLAALARLDETVPAPLVLGAARFSFEKLQAAFDKLLDSPRFDARRLRKLAACAVALAILMEAQEEGSDAQEGPD